MKRTMKLKRNLNLRQAISETEGCAGSITGLRFLLSALSLAMLSACADKPPEIRLALGTVAKVQFAFAGWNDLTQIEAAGRSISLKGIAPIPVNTAVELRGSKQHAEQLCVGGTDRCWLLHQPAQHAWALLSLRP
jgi:hypothetical protein